MPPLADRPRVIGRNGPGMARAREELQALQRERAHRLELGYFFEHFNADTTDPQAGFGSVNVRVN